ncbi:MAG: ECF-type sigma factor [Lysobacterales bacterium]
MRGATLETRALVNEAYLKLCGHEGEYQPQPSALATAAQAMRQIIIDHARARQADRRGGAQAVSLAALEIRIDQAMRRLGELDPRLERVAELRYFAGLEVDEVAGPRRLRP